MNDLNQNSHGGSMHNAQSTAYNSGNYKDPLEHYSERKAKEAKGGEGSFLDTFILHGQVHECEAQLQFLNSNKSDKGGTSVGISDAKLRFLSIRSHGIIMISLWSLIFNFIIFAFLFLFVNQLIAMITSALLLIHVFIPAYVIYGMKRFVDGEKFTKPYYKKLLGVWRLFEIFYLAALGGVIYCTTLDWNALYIKFIGYIKGSKVLAIIFTKYLKLFNFNLIEGMFSAFSVVMILGIIFYLVMAYRRDKLANALQEGIKFEHDKEILRPIEIARIKQGKIKRK